MSGVDEIGAKYFVQKEVPEDDRAPLKQNLQADINKVEGIIRRLSDKKAPQSELNRLRTHVARLLAVIDNNDQLHL